MLCTACDLSLSIARLHMNLLLVSAMYTALPHLRVLRVSNCHGLKGIIGATDSYASSSSTNAKWAATVRPQPIDHDTAQQQQQLDNGDTADSSTNSSAVVTFSETTTPEQGQRRQLSTSSDLDGDVKSSSTAAAATASATDVASPDENSEHDCSDAAADTSYEQLCDDSTTDAESEQQAREFDCYVNSRLVPLTGKKGRGSVMFSSSYSAVQNAAVQAAAALLGLSYSDTDNGAKVSASAISSDASSLRFADDGSDSTSSQQQRGSSKQKRRDAWSSSDAANDANSSTANGSNGHNSSDSTAAGSGTAVTTVNAPFLQNIEVVADARSLKKLEQLAGLLPRERGGTKRVICLRYQKGVCNRRPLDCEWAHFQGNLQKIGRFKPLLDLVHMVEGSKKGSAKARRPRSDSFGEAASAAAAVLAGSSGQSSGSVGSGSSSGQMSAAALQAGADGGSSGSRSRGGSVGSATEASMPSLVFPSLQVSLYSVVCCMVTTIELVAVVLLTLLQISSTVLLRVLSLLLKQRYEHTHTASTCNTCNVRPMMLSCTFTHVR
jgi:hypothetical protein